MALKRKFKYEGFNLNHYTFSILENIEDIEISEQDFDPILKLKKDLNLNQEYDFDQNPTTWIR